jgi:MYXO-CTERM domain-containing protein
LKAAAVRRISGADMRRDGTVVAPRALADENARMRGRLVALLASAAAFVAVMAPAPASAHFYVDYPDAAVYPGPSPVPWWSQDALGGPQKLGPCGDDDDATMAGGGPTYVITPYQPGATVTLQWTETISHAGWFRIALAADRSAFVDPPIFIDKNGNSADAGIESPPAGPVIADGVYVHALGPPKTWPPYTFTLPTTPCPKCTIQIIQVMLDHPSNLPNLPDGATNPDGFLYHHCMDISIGPPADGGAPPSPPSPDDGGTGGAGMTSGSSSSGGGCSIGSAPPVAGAVVAIFALAAFARRRRHPR